ncbi:MAG TPA: UDP-2,3-diacylglucosamine diphosphatase LpxI [Rhizomicrobium sp.]|jgi:hypothetical protein|nr:UDP-2,3-diacylglucosamine diphosphatase LpxI [Rhizomicrobium sp.]
MPALGIIAGGGDLPIAVAESAISAGREIFIVALLGSADEQVTRFPHGWSSLGEVNKTFGLLRDNNCSEVLLAGKVARPKFSEIKLDARGVLLLPKVVAAARKGDDALLRMLVDLFETAGFKTVGVTEAAPGLIVLDGPIGRIEPTSEQQTDIQTANDVVRRLGELDVGQAAIVCDGLVLAVEAAEGTDATVARVGALPENIRGTPAKRRGVLVKALKPRQDGKTDLPVIGVQTVRNVAAVGLAGIALQAGGALIVNRLAVAAAADEAGIFVVGFTPRADAG